MQRIILTLAFLLIGAGGFGLDLAAPQQTDLATLAAKADRDSDLDAAIALVPLLQDRVAADPSIDNRLLLGRNCLTIAEIKRYEYEKAKDMDPRDRRLLGRSGDEYAKIGHDAVDPLPNDNSEKWRIKADLYGTMIRSLYKGDRKSTRLNSSHIQKSRMPSSA